MLIWEICQIGFESQWQKSFSIKIRGIKRLNFTSCGPTACEPWTRLRFWRLFCSQDIRCSPTSSVVYRRLTRRHCATSSGGSRRSTVRTVCGIRCTRKASRCSGKSIEKSRFNSLKTWDDHMFGQVVWRSDQTFFILFTYVLLYINWTW